MKRYFFDLATSSSVHYDFKGRDIEQFQQALEIAELFALDIECSIQDNLFPVEVQVRNIKGDKLFCVPISAPETIAA
jgi:hypothetical protein